MSLYSCPICGAGLRFLIGRVDKYQYFDCPHCSHVASFPAPPPDELTAFYSGFLHRLPSPEAQQERQAVISRCTARIAGDGEAIAALRTPFRVLDWGGGTGYYANGFAELGCECTLVDIDDKACDHAAEHFGARLSVINADPTVYPWQGEFDVVFCSHVIEHVVDPIACLAAMRRALRPGGIVILSTPNQQCKEFPFRFRWFLSYLKKTSRNRRELVSSLIKCLQTSWLCCDPPRHLHAFNRKSLGLAASKAGFEVLKSFGEYFDSQDYQYSRFETPWRLSGLRSIAGSFYRFYAKSGFRLLRLLAPDGKWGSNLVLFARNPSNRRAASVCE